MVKPPCERGCPRRSAECHAKRAEYRARENERSRDAYTADAKKRCKSVERLRKAGLLK